MNESKQKIMEATQDTAESGLGPKSRRSFKNFLIYPSGQIRFIFGIPFITTLAVAVIFNELKSKLVEDLLDLQRSLPEAAVRIESLVQAVRSILAVGIVCSLLSAFLIAVLGLSITHHFYGPLVPILRKLEKMKEGNFSEPIHLRKEDELKQLASAINELSESMEKLAR